MKRLAITFGLLMVLLAIAAVLQLMLIFTSPASEEQPGEAPAASIADGASEGVDGEDKPAQHAIVDNVSKSLQIAEARREAQLSKRVEQLMGGGDIIVNGAPLSKEQARRIVEDDANYPSRVKLINQQDVLPSGCEIVALTVALRAEGFKADPTDIADNYLPRGNKLSTEYRGSPYTNGGGLPPCIVTAGNQWFAAHGDGGAVYDLTGSTFDGLLRLLDEGYPVMVWVTEKLEKPTFRGAIDNGLQWYAPEHTVIMYGAKGDKILVCDSLEGMVTRERARIAEIYDACGKKSLFVQPVATSEQASS